jgi:hypothetical protein
VVSSQVASPFASVVKPLPGELWVVSLCETIYKEAIGDEDGSEVFEARDGDVLLVIGDGNEKWKEVEVLTRFGTGFVSYLHIKRLG